MIDAFFSQSNYVTAKKMLEASVLRHEALATNLANVETPGYRRLDVSPEFAAALQQAAGRQDTAQIAALQPKLAPDASAVAMRPDGNTVQLENELLAMNENSLQHALEAQLLTGSLLKLRLAITGRSS